MSCGGPSSFVGIGTIEDIGLVKPAMRRLYKRVKSRDAFLCMALAFLADTTRLLLHQFKYKLRKGDAALIRAIPHLVFHCGRYIQRHAHDILLSLDPINLQQKKQMVCDGLKPPQTIFPSLTSRRAS